MIDGKPWRYDGTIFPYNLWKNKGNIEHYKDERGLENSSRTPQYHVAIRNTKLSKCYAKMFLDVCNEASCKGFKSNRKISKNSVWKSSRLPNRRHSKEYYENKRQPANYPIFLTNINKTD